MTQIEIDTKHTLAGLPIPHNWHILERHSDKDGTYGVGYERLTGEAIRVIESIAVREDGKRWLHVSVSKPNMRKVPTYDDLHTMRKAFIDEDKECYQVFPPEERYVDIGPVLHLFCCLDQPKGVLPHFEGEITKGVRSI
jgi:hypothetical protein